MDLCHDLGIQATFYFTANGAHVYPDRMKRLQAQGHEIGCHGLTHEDEEDYDRMPKDLQDAYIAEAAEKLATLSGAFPRAFRSPRVKTSAYTLKKLGEHGYWTDSSVCSQRMDLISSNLINVDWLRAPRRSYHPHFSSAFKPGNLPVWEVPVSAVIVPFISSALNVFGLLTMKMLFRLLYAESRLTGKPIVYLAHPVEFIRRKSGQQGKKRGRIPYLTREYLSLSFIRTHGFRIRKLLYRMDGETLLAKTQALFTYMTSFPDVTPMTASEYAIRHLQVAPDSD